MKAPLSLVRTLGLAGLASCLAFLSGCVTTNESGGTPMVPPPVAVARSHAGSITVEVTGGAESVGLGLRGLSNLEFASAIAACITQSKAFGSIVPAGSPGDYALDVQIVRLDQPTFGGAFTVTLESTWRLRSTAGNKVVWEKASKQR